MPCAPRISERPHLTLQKAMNCTPKDRILQCKMPPIGKRLEMKHVACCFLPYTVWLCNVMPVCVHQSSSTVTPDTLLTATNRAWRFISSPLPWQDILKSFHPSATSTMLILALGLLLHCGVKLFTQTFIKSRTMRTAFTPRCRHFSGSCRGISRVMKDNWASSSSPKLKQIDCISTQLSDGKPSLP